MSCEKNESDFWIKNNKKKTKNIPLKKVAYNKKVFLMNSESQFKVNIHNKMLIQSR